MCYNDRSGQIRRLLGFRMTLAPMGCLSRRCSTMVLFVFHANPPSTMQVIFARLSHRLHFWHCFRSSSHTYFFLNDFCGFRSLPRMHTYNPLLQSNNQHEQLPINTINQQAPPWLGMLLGMMSVPSWPRQVLVANLIQTARRRASVTCH